MGKKAIHADLGTFTPISAYSGIIQAYSESSVMLTYSERWYSQNQNPRHIQNPIKPLR